MNQTAPQLPAGTVAETTRPFDRMLTGEQVVVGRVIGPHARDEVYEIEYRGKRGRAYRSDLRPLGATFDGDRA